MGGGREDFGQREEGGGRPNFEEGRGGKVSVEEERE